MQCLVMKTAFQTEALVHGFYFCNELIVFPIVLRELWI